MKAVSCVAFSVVAAPLFAVTPFDKMALKGRTDKANPVGYTAGEPIVFTIRTEDIESVPTDDTYRIKWMRTGDDGRSAEGYCPFVIGETCVVTTKLDRPGFVRLEAFLVAGADNHRVKRDCLAPGSPAWAGEKEVFFDGGAGVDIGKITQFKPEPADFDAFWAKQKELAKTVPVKADVKDVKTVNGCRIMAVSVDCFGPRPVTGYLFIPENAAPKSCSARVGFQGYGFYRQACPEWARWGCVAKKEIFLEINAHGYELDREAEYYKTFEKGIRTPKYTYAFSPEENAKPETAYFRAMAHRVMRALEYVKTLPEWNGKDLVAEGGSQGGLQTSWAAGLDPDVTLARPGITWCCDLGATEPGGRLHGNWFIKWTPGIDYFDAVNHIKRAKCPVEITRAGLGDYTCPPSGLAVYYNAIPGKKSVNWVQGSRHGFVPRGANQTIVLGDFNPTGGESKSQNASKDVR